MVAAPGGILAGAGKRPLRYIGRRAAAATAVGSHRLHKEVQEKLLEEAFNLQAD